MGYLKGATGDSSSKRLWGSIYLAAALLLAFLDMLTDRKLSFDVFLAILITGGSLIGLGLVELFSKAGIKGGRLTAITPPDDDPPPQPPPEGDQ